MLYFDGSPRHQLEAGLLTPPAHPLLLASTMRTRRSRDSGEAEYVAPTEEKELTEKLLPQADSPVGRDTSAANSESDVKVKSTDAGEQEELTKKTLPAQVGRVSTPYNPLSKVRPGYVARMQLATPSLDKFTSAGGLESLRKAATKQDYKAALEKSSSRAQKATTLGQTPGSRNRRLKEQGMLDPSADPTLAQDLHLLRHRNYLDPKRFYKNPDLPGKWVQRGTYIEDGKRVRQGTLVDQVIGAHQESAYVKRKYQTMQRTQQEKAQKRFKRSKKR